MSNLEISVNEVKEKLNNIGNGLILANELLLEGLKECDKEKFESAKSHIKNIANKTDEIDNDIVKILALYSPEARDLRQVVSFFKITNELSRSCSNTRNFLRGLIDFCSDLEMKSIQEYAIPMQTSTLKAVKCAINMLNMNDIDEIQDTYNEVLIEQNKTDDLYEMFEKSIHSQVEMIQDFERYHTMLRSLRKSSKIADRAISIANLLMYVKMGGTLQNQ